MIIVSLLLKSIQTFKNIPSHNYNFSVYSTVTVSPIDITNINNCFHGISIFDLTHSYMQVLYVTFLSHSFSRTKLLYFESLPQKLQKFCSPKINMHTMCCVSLLVAEINPCFLLL